LGVPEPGHIPVLLDEVLALLDPRPGEVFLDCTAGLGGHAAAVAPRLGAAGTIVLNDADPANLERARARVEPLGPRGVAFAGNFADAPRRLAERGLAADLVLADLGFSSNQIEDAARGFSFARDGPLDMRLDPTLPVSAADLVASLPEPELARIIREYGEDRDAPRIARKLVESRRAGPISTTGQLAQIVRHASGRRPTRDSIDPATRTFQALRIAVNDELGSLESLLDWIRRGAERTAGSWLKPGARVAIIAFHSLEDRPVKRAFAGLVSGGVATALTRRPVEADGSEVSRNPRSRSARLRAIRIGGGAVGE
jgi:16S rRNA (cytosine1402-N4)-methyltransferase